MSAEVDHQSETVPFHEASLEEVKVNVVFTSIRLKNGRTVGVGNIPDTSDLAVRVTRETLDNKTAELVFGLSNEAAVTLFILIGEALNLTHIGSHD